jgi:glycerophosphoryl diester phosphodiesterase
MFKIGALLLGLILCAGCSANAPAPEPTSGPASALPSSSSTFTLVAHRGGALVNPESSTEAFESVSRTGFPIETDLRQLKDGTLVPLHDETVDRTMTGVTGRPTKLSLDQWMAAHIRALPGGVQGTPTTWEAMLDKYGGRNLLVPEIKDPGIDLAAFASSILGRGVQSKVIVQTFSYQAARTLAESGLHVLYLLRKHDEPDPAEIRSSGIDHVGPDKSVSADYLRALKASGLTVWPYTVNDEPTASRLRRDGADGIFTDNPWALSKQLELG